MSDYPMLISNKLHSFRNFIAQYYKKRYTNFRFKLLFYAKARYIGTSMKRM